MSGDVQTCSWLWFFVRCSALKSLMSRCRTMSTLSSSDSGNMQPCGRSSTRTINTSVPNVSVLSDRIP